MFQFFLEVSDILIIKIILVLYLVSDSDILFGGKGAIFPGGGGEHRDTKLQCDQKNKLRTRQNLSQRVNLCCPRKAHRFCRVKVRNSTTNSRNRGFLEELKQQARLDLCICMYLHILHNHALWNDHSDIMRWSKTSGGWAHFHIRRPNRSTSVLFLTDERIFVVQPLAGSVPLLVDCLRKHVKEPKIVVPVTRPSL